MKGRIVLREGDITEEAVDAVVNAANSHLHLGAGVAGAIREKGGASIQRECDAVGPIPVGQAALTGAGKLPARYVLHAATMEPGGQATEESVRASMRHCLDLARAHGFGSVAVPALGAGIAGFPMRRCAEILLHEARHHLSGDTPLHEIRFVLFGENAYRVFEAVEDSLHIAESLRSLQEPGC